MSAAAKHASTPKQRVLVQFPSAVCQHDQTAPGPGISWAIYEHPAGKSPGSFRHRITGGWMTPAQAWERAAARIKEGTLGAPKRARPRSVNKTVADLEDMLRQWPRQAKLMVDINGIDRPVRNIQTIWRDGCLTVQLKTAREA